MAKPLTVKSIEAIKPGPVRREIPDGGLSGLYIVVQPKKNDVVSDTRRLSWAYRYRSPIDGKPKKLTIGTYPAFGLVDARKAAGKAARDISERRDPGAEKIAARKASQDRTDLVGELLDTFITRHVDKKKDSTAAEMKRLIEREVRPAWGTKKIHSIARRDVIDLLDGIVARGAETTANRVLALVRKFGNWSVERGIIDSSPVAGVKAPSEENARDRVLSDDEIRWLWAATETGMMGHAVRLMLLTGQRRGEVVGMGKNEVKAGDVWYIPANRTKNGVANAVPLAPVSQDIITALPKLKDKDLIFTSTGDTPISGWSKFKLSLDKAMLKIAQEEAEERGDDPAVISLPQWQLHDLRRTAASGMARLGQPVHVVEALLNHKSGTVSGVAAVYNRYDYADEKRRAAEAWANYLDKLINGKPDNVRELRAV